MVELATKTTVTETTYWDCGYHGQYGHAHTTKAIAERCERRRLNRESGFDLHKFWRERRIQGVERWLEVRNFSQVARELGVRPTTVRNWVHMYRRRAQQNDPGNRHNFAAWRHIVPSAHYSAGRAVEIGRRDVDPDRADTDYWRVGATNMLWRNHLGRDLLTAFSE